MNCFRHGNRLTEIVCESCERPICEECQVLVGDKSFCRQCIEDSLSKKEHELKIEQEYKIEQEKENMFRKESINTKRVGERRSRFLTFILSLVPGVGYLYLGLMKRGLQTLVTFFGSIFVGNLIGLDSIVALVVPVLMFYTIFDCQQLVRKMNEGESLEDNELFTLDWLEFDHKWVGYGLIALGVLALLNNVVPMLIPRYYLRSMLAPFLIIGVGVYILYKNTKKEI